MAGQPYVVITADSHAGASVETYRDYLDEKHKQRFDDWRGSYRNPQQKHIGSKKHKNWDDAERMKDMQAEGIAGEVIFPNTVPPFFSTLVRKNGGAGVGEMNPPAVAPARLVFIGPGASPVFFFFLSLCFCCRV